MNMFARQFRQACASPPERRETIRRSLRASMREGVAAHVMIGITEQYLVPFAIALKASNQAVGVLNAAKHLAQALCQLYAPALTNHLRSRNRVILAGVLCQAVACVPLALLPFVAPSAWRVSACILLSAVVALAGSCIVPAWASLMADHVPERIRGRYFGWRSQRLGLVNLVSAFAAGALLHLARSREAAGFAALLLISALARLVSWHYQRQMHDPTPATSEPTPHVPIWRLLHARHAFSPFLWFVGAFLFAVYLASPFIAVYLLKELRYSYVMFAAVQLAAQLSAFVMLRHWGRRADRFGNIKVIKACTLGVILIPFLWLAPPSLPYLLAVQVFSGIAWSGLNLALFNFAFDAAPAQQRASFVAGATLVNGLGIFLGSLAGGWLATHLPAWHGRHIPPLFLVSGLARLAVGVAWVRRLKEVRRVSPRSTIDLAVEPGRLLLELILRPFGTRP